MYLFKTKLCKKKKNRDCKSEDLELESTAEL